MAKFLITGTAGFIGFHLANSLLEAGNEVVGLDNINNYYDVNLKYARLKEAGIDGDLVNWNILVQSKKFSGYRFTRINLEAKPEILELFSNENFDYVVHLAAQAGVRYSIENPDAYIQSNIVGFFNILEACRRFPVRHLFYASSSSVYGNNSKVPFSEDDPVDNPISLYAATKRSNELMAFNYNHLYGIPVTGFRFFTVYGPWGRPDMAVWKFTEAIKQNKQLQVYAEGKLKRDFTYIDDIIEGIMSVIINLETEKPSKVINIGNNRPISVIELIGYIEHILGLKAVIEFKPLQQGDVDATFADITLINKHYGFAPKTSPKVGLQRFCTWYLDKYSVQEP